MAILSHKMRKPLTVASTLFMAVAMESCAGANAVDAKRQSDATTMVFEMTPNIHRQQCVFESQTSELGDISVVVSVADNTSYGFRVSAGRDLIADAVAMNRGDFFVAINNASGVLFLYDEAHEGLFRVLPGPFSGPHDDMDNARYHVPEVWGILDQEQKMYGTCRRALAPAL